LSRYHKLLLRRTPHADHLYRAVGLALLLLTLPAQNAWAIRPFVTDDARVVGQHRLQLETWLQADNDSTEHWAVATFGPTENTELSAGGFYGLNYQSRRMKFAVGGPIFQCKVLLHPIEPNSWPGMAVAGGAVSPYGTGGFEAGGWDPFTYLAITESLFQDDTVLLHANLGIHKAAGTGTKATWGAGTQIHIDGPWNAIGEVYSGDPYSNSSGSAAQAGFRYVIGEQMQIDGSIGRGVSGGGERTALSGSLGLRLVSKPLW